MNVSIEDTTDSDSRYSPDFISSLLSKWQWILASVIFFTCVFGAVAFLITPIYRASTLLVPAGSERGNGSLDGALSQLGGLAAIAGINVGPRSAADEESLAVLKSREFTDAFIRQANLMQRLYADKWDPATGAWKQGEQHQPTVAMAYKYFDTKIRTIIQDKKTGLVTLQIDWKDRNEAASWANVLVSDINEEMRRRAIASVDASVKYLEKEYGVTSDISTREAISRLMEAQVKQRMLANVNQQYAFRVVDPAEPPDANDTVKPKRVVLILGGAFFGLTLAVLLIMAWARTAKANAGKRRGSGAAEIL